MRWLTFLLIPIFAAIGAANARQEWTGALGGSIVGLFFALAFSDALPKKLVDWMFPPEDEDRAIEP